MLESTAIDPTTVTPTAQAAECGSHQPEHDLAGEPLAPPAGHPRFPLVDGLRALAALAVVVVHARVMGGPAGGAAPTRLLSHLNVGVALFFAISGFLLYRPFIAQRTSGAPRPHASGYLVRRGLRIYPAFWLIVTALALIPPLQATVAPGLWRKYLILTLPTPPLHNCTTAVTTCAVAQTWSLVPELTFYFVLPVYAAAMRGLTRRASLRSWVALELGALALISAFSVELQFGGASSGLTGWWQYSALAYALWFSAGMGLAVVSVARHGGARLPSPLRLLGQPALAWLAAAGVYAALSLSLAPTPYLLARHEQLLAHLGFALIAGLMLAPLVLGDGAPRGLPARVTGHPLMRWLGLVSYGIFLWHYVFAIKLGAGGAHASFVPVLVGSAAGSIALGALSFYALERPLMRLRYRPAPWWPRGQWRTARRGARPR